jgi:hypothetical protein
MSDQFPLAARRYFYQSPPRSNQNTKTVGSVVTLATSAVAISVNLALLLAQVFNQTDASLRQPAGVLGNDGNFLSIFADTTDIGLIFGETQALVTGANAPVLATVDTVNGSGVVTAVAGVCYRIPAGKEERYHLQPNKDLWVAIVATGAGLVRLFQSNPPDP